MRGSDTPQLALTKPSPAACGGCHRRVGHTQGPQTPPLTQILALKKGTAGTQHTASSPGAGLWLRCYHGAWRAPAAAAGPVCRGCSHCWGGVCSLLCFRVFLCFFSPFHISSLQVTEALVRFFPQLRSAQCCTRQPLAPVLFCRGWGPSQGSPAGFAGFPPCAVLGPSLQHHEGSEMLQKANCAGLCPQHGPVPCWPSVFGRTSLLLARLHS